MTLVDARRRQRAADRSGVTTSPFFSDDAVDPHRMRDESRRPPRATGTAPNFMRAALSERSGFLRKRGDDFAR